MPGAKRRAFSEKEIRLAHRSVRTGAGFGRRLTRAAPAQSARLAAVVRMPMRRRVLADMAHLIPGYPDPITPDRLQGWEAFQLSAASGCGRRWARYSFQMSHSTARSNKVSSISHGECVKVKR